MITLLKRFKPEEYSEKFEHHTFRYDPAETLEKAHERARARVKAAGDAE
jgi:hypothetical protein